MGSASSKATGATADATGAALNATGQAISALLGGNVPVNTFLAFGLARPPNAGEEPGDEGVIVDSVVNVFPTRAVGEGAFGVVVEAEIVAETGTTRVVAKSLGSRLRRGNEATRRRAMQELVKEALIQMGAPEHDNLLKCIGFAVDEHLSPHYVILEHAHGTFGDALRDGLFDTLNDKLEVALDVARGINALHTANPAIIHRDFHPDNILFVDNLTKVGDFGKGRVIGNRYYIGHNSDSGMIKFSAPEALIRWPGEDPILLAALDVYFFGALLLSLTLDDWELLPHGHDDRLQRANAFPDNPDLVDLMMSCMDPDPDERPRMVDVIASLDAIVQQ